MTNIAQICARPLQLKAASISRARCALRAAGPWVAALALGVLASVTLPAVAQPAAAAPAAQKQEAVGVVLVQSKVVQGADGKEQLIAAESVRPGDLIEYRATYTNNTGRPITGLVANLPIPDGLEYQAGSAKPGGNLVTAATQDGRFAAEPLTRTLNGKKQPVPYNEYRSLRWALGQLPSSGSTAVSARARVESVAAPVPSASTAVK